MKTVSQIKNELLNIKIPADFNKSFEDLKKDIQKSYKRNGYGCSDHFKAVKSGYSISYTDNNNYAGGVKNGFGAGYYAHLNYTGFTKTIKL